MAWICRWTSKARSGPKSPDKADGDMAPIIDRVSSTSAGAGAAPNVARAIQSAEVVGGEEAATAALGPAEAPGGATGQGGADEDAARTGHDRPGGRGREHQAADVPPQLVGPAHREELADHATHRVADEQPAGDVEGLQNLEQVVGQPLERVAVVAGQGLAVAALADGDHPVPVAQLAELGRPRRHAEGDAVDEHDRRPAPPLDGVDAAAVVDGDEVVLEVRRQRPPAGDQVVLAHLPAPGGDPLQRVGGAGGRGEGGRGDGPAGRPHGPTTADPVGPVGPVGPAVSV